MRLKNTKRDCLLDISKDCYLAEYLGFEINAEFIQTMREQKDKL